MAITKDFEALARVHASMARAYTTVGWLFLEIPTSELLDSAESELASIRQELLRVLPELATDVDRLCGTTSESLTDIRTDYAGLFAGVRKLPAPPWESCYLSGKRLVCTEITESVRQAYLEACLCQDPADAQPDDHIGLELQFVGAMSKHISDALEAANPALADVTTSQRADFITEHLSKWVPAFCSDLENAAGTEFYRSLARLTADLVKCEMEATQRCSD